MTDRAPNARKPESERRRHRSRRVGPIADACEAAGVAIVVGRNDQAASAAAVRAALEETHVQRASQAAKQISAMPSADELVLSLEALGNR